MMVVFIVLICVIYLLIGYVDISDKNIDMSVVIMILFEEKRLDELD